MNEILDKVFEANWKKFKNTQEYKKELKNAEHNKELLKTYLNKRQRRLLLRITDHTNLMEYQMAYNYFNFGFNIGLKLGYETSHNSIR